MDEAGPPSRLERPQPFEELSHTADAAVRVRARSPEELLARLVVTFGELLTGEEQPFAATGARRIEAEPADRAMMAIDILCELLYAFDTEGLVPVWCECRSVEPDRSTVASVGLGRYDPDTHREGLDIKAVTLHAARFEQEDGDWVAEVVFDI